MVRNSRVCLRTVLVASSRAVAFGRTATKHGHDLDYELNIVYSNLLVNCHSSVCAERLNLLYPALLAHMTFP